MAMLCVVPPDGVLSESAFPRSKIPSISRTGWDRRIEEIENLYNMRQINNALYGARPEWRYHTAIAVHQEGKAYTRLQRNTRPTYTQALERASVLVAELLQQLQITPLPFGLPSPLPPYHVEDSAPAYDLDEELARSLPISYPFPSAPSRLRDPEKKSEGQHNMFGDADFGDTSGFQTRGNKKAKKAAKQAQQSKWTDDPEEGEKAGGEGGEDGGSGGAGEGGGSGGAGGDDDGGEGGKDDEDDWNFGGGKKNKKKTSKKKQQEEEEEEERKKKEEEDAANANKDPLSWADDTNDAAGADDWTTGFTVAKDKKKKKKGASEEPVSALPEAPTISNFQDISLDDGAPKLEFSFDGGDSKKDTGFGTWGKTWDFGSLDKPDDKKSKETKDSSTTFGDNNPWSLGGSKNKKKTTTTGFDFGNFGAADEITFDTGDLGDTKAATDDAWGFSAVDKKEKKKKKDDAEEKTSATAAEVAPVVEDSWGSWGTAGKKKGKKDTFDDITAPPPAAPEPPAAEEWSSFGFGKKDKKKAIKEVEEPTVTEPEPVDAFDWGFGTKKDKKKKGLIDEIKEDPPADPLAEPESTGGGGDDWIGGWGTTTKKKDKKGKKGGIEDLSASIDLGSTADTNATKEEPAGDDLWSFGTSKKDKKKGKKGVADDEALSASITETPAAAEGDIWSAFGSKSKKGKTTSPDPIDDPVIEEPEPVKEELPAWDFGLTPMQKRKKEKEMRKANLWPFGDIGKPVEPVKEAESEPILEEPEIVPEEKPEPVKIEPPAWDFGLSEKDKKKKEKEMKKKNLWPFGDIGKPVESVEPEIIAEPLAEEAPKEEPVPWDFGLTALQRKKKEKEMRKANLWPFGDIGKPVEPEPVEPEPVEPEPEPETQLEEEPEPEPEAPEDEALPWDFGLSAKEKKKKEKEMKQKNLWPFGDIGKPAEKKAKKEPEPEIFHEELEQEPEPEPEPEILEEEPPPWDFGLTPVQKKKKEKDMRKKNLWPFGDIGKPVKREPEPEPEPEVEPKPEPEPEVESAKNDMWGTWGMTSKEKKKKDSKVKSADPEPAAKSVKEEEETNFDDDGGWGFSLSSKDKKKKEKDVKAKDSLSPAEEKPSVFDHKPAEDDIWGSFSAVKSKDTKKGKKGKIVEEPPPPVPTPPAQGLSPEQVPAEDTQLDVLEEDTWGGLTKTKSKTKAVTSPAEEKKSSIWGFSSSTKVKTKKEKEAEAKAKKEAEEKAAREAEDAAAREEEERLQREIDEAEAAEAAEAAAAAAAALKPGKKSKDSKSAKSSGKLLDEKKKSKEAAPYDLLDETMPAEEKAEEKNDDYFGFWGSGPTKKTAGKKDKEITRKETTNESDPLADFTNLDFMASDKAEPLPSKSSKTVTGKSKVGSSIAERIKALEAKKSGKEDSGMKKVVDEPITKDEFALNETLSPKEEKKAGKIKTSSKSKKDDAFQPPSPVLESKAKKSKDSVPGSFPDAFGEEEEDLLADELVPPPKVESDKVKKSGKADKKSAKTSKKVKAQEDPEQVVEKDLMDDLLDLDSPKLPTPPPEEERKPARKERARVERTGTTAAWGFWGAAPPKKKESSKKKVSGDATPPLVEKEKKPSPALGRSKSTRTPKEKEKEDKRESEKISKSSDSDKDSKKTERPSKPARGMSFSQFMLGGPPPSAMRSKPSRRSSNAGGGSRSSSRARSDEGGLMSPPPEDAPQTNEKAAKLMGIKTRGVERTRSVKTKSKAYVDPYPIDDDDMVMINAPEIQSPPPTVEKKSKGKVSSRRTSTKPRSKTISGDEDVVMVDNVAMEPHVTSGPEEFSPSLKRGNSVKKSTGFFGSIFGAPKVVAEPRQVLTDAEDAALPIRTKSTSKRRSKIPDADGGFTTDAPMETDADNEARSMQRKTKRDAYRMAEEEDRMERETRRRERREREQADLEARRARARDKARKQQEEEEAQKEARRERRRQKEAERDRAAQAEEDLNAAADQRRAERARLRAELEAANPDGIPNKEDRRQTYLAEEDGRQRRRESRKTKDDTSRRKSSALVAEYHNSRSGKGGGIAPPANKTSSWIASQNDEPPDVPPISETILDPSGEKSRSIDEIDDGSGSRRRKDKYSGMTETDIEEHRARRRARRAEREKAMSGGSDDRGRSRKEYDTYGEPIKTFDGRPALARGDSKRNSFLGRFF